MDNEANDKKVLIVTYYWPPSGGSGVQRWLKFVKYLPEFGVTPFVFTPENPSFDLKDESLLHNVPPEAEVLHFPIWEPYHLFKKMTGEKSVTVAVHTAFQEQSFTKRLGVWLRGNLFIPDPRRFWVRPSVAFLSDFIAEKKIRTIITTGPPHSMHLIGLRLKKKNPQLRWIADFRDPWSEWGLLDTLRVGSVARWFHRRLERKVLQTANVVTTITPFYVRQFKRLGGRRVELFTNGYDEDDFREFKRRPTNKFMIRHIGVVLDKVNTVPFMEAVAVAGERDTGFKRDVQINFTGDVNGTFQAYVNEHPFLGTCTTFSRPVPHREVFRLYENSSLLVMILAGLKDLEGYMPGKLFEYMATGVPVLGVGPEAGDAADLMKQSGIGAMVEPSDREKMTTLLLTHYRCWKNNETLPTSAALAYSRRYITQQLADIL